MTGTVTTSDPAPGVRRISFANPGKRGALDHPILDGIAAAVGTAQSDGGVRCLILTGSGRDFSSGYDIGDIPPEQFSARAEALVAHPYTNAVDALVATPLATVAALGGHTIGGGLELALACDLRLARNGIRIGMPPAKLGLVYSHTGIARFLNAVGETRTRELFLLGRHYDAQTAASWGLVNGVCADAAELESEALAWAGELAAGSPTSISGNKEILRALLTAPPDATTADRLEALRRGCFAAGGELEEGVRAFSEKRRPSWSQP